MKTLYLSQLMVYGEGLPALKSGTRFFIIAVKQGDSLENLQRKYPQIVIERLPEVGNMNYLSQDSMDDNHMLQPAFITWKEPK